MDTMRGWPIRRAATRRLRALFARRAVPPKWAVVSSRTMARRRGTVARASRNCRAVLGAAKSVDTPRPRTSVASIASCATTALCRLIRRRHRVWCRASPASRNDTRSATRPLRRRRRRHRRRHRLPLRRPKCHLCDHWKAALHWMDSARPPRRARRRAASRRRSRCQSRRSCRVPSRRRRWRRQSWRMARAFGARALRPGSHSKPPDFGVG